MKTDRIFSIFMMLLCCLVISVNAPAQEDTGTGNESNPLMQGLMGILQESIDEFIGSYKGSLGDVRLIERLGNKVVLEVTYDNVKRSDNVHVQGEVLNFGTPLEGFSNSLNPVTGSHGKVRLALGWSPEGDDGWGTSSSEVQSDQIRLFLVRKSNPDRPFGEIVYDMSKTWTASNAPDEETMVADADSIELEEDVSGSGNAPKPGVFIKPGTILIPKTAKPAAVPAQTAPAVSTSPPASTVKTVPMATTARAVQPSYKISTYDFYTQAKSAVWKSGAGVLPFPGRANDDRGFARQRATGKISPGTAAVSMLETRPQKKATGWIDAHFPMMVLGDNLQFKSIAGFLYGTNKTNGATFQVYVKESGKYYRVINRWVNAEKYLPIDADLSRWAGKKVQIVLRVRTGKNSSPDRAVWVKPRLSK